jgi:hypothetical protein
MKGAKMLNKIHLFVQIRKFYKLFGTEVGSSFINKLSDVTTDNVYDVLFDINEIREVCEDPWLDKLQNQIMHFCSRLPKIKHDYTAVIFVLLAVASVVGGCIIGVELNKCMEAKPVVSEQPHTRYTAYGRYYTDGTVITNDGNEWSYSTDVVSDKTPYDNMPVWIGFDDNGTGDITDDIVLGLVYDRNTAIYDALETALSDEFELERDGNNIRIGGIK